MPTEKASEARVRYLEKKKNLLEKIILVIGASDVVFFLVALSFYGFIFTRQRGATASTVETAIFLILMGLSFTLNRRGHTQAAAFITLIAIAIYTTCSLVFWGTPSSDMTVIALVIDVVIAGMLLERRGVAITTALVVALFLLALALELAGVITGDTPLSFYDKLWNGIVIVFSIVLAAFSSWVVSGHLEDSFKEELHRAESFKGEVEKRAGELHMSEEKYRRLIESAIDAIIVTDEEGHIQEVNPATGRLLIYSPEELHNTPFLRLVHPDCRDEAVPSMRALHEGETIIRETKLARKDGVPVDVEILATSFEVRGSHLFQYIIHDLTAKKELQTRLLQTEKTAALGEMIAGVAHELNNPLASVQGYAQLLQMRTDLPPEVREDLERIVVQAKRSVRIVRNLLTFARQREAERSWVNLKDVINLTMELRAYSLRVNDIDVVLEVAPQTPFIRADANQLQQVLLNLVNNSIDAMMPVEISRKLLTIKVAPFGEDRVQLEVSDTGTGIPASIQPAVFDPFFTTKPAGQGTGLGLSVCIGIVRDHEGQIWFESREGEGTTFFIELPVGRLTGEEDTRPSLKRGLEDEQEQEEEKAKPPLLILVIDDEENIADVFRRILEKKGHTVDVALNGEDGLKYTGANNYDVVICDVKMPGIDGRQYYERIACEQPDMVKNIIFSTGDVMSDDTREFLAATGRPCLKKPFEKNDLYEAVEKAVAGSTSQPPP